MPRSTLRAFERLNDFLPSTRRQRPFCLDVAPETSIKDFIESVGIPHPEIAFILVDGRPVDFSFRLTDDARVSVYPPFCRIRVVAEPELRPEIIGEPRFVVDTHLGTLARYLRMLGFNTIYQNDAHDATLAEVSSRDGRVLLTQDVGLLKRRSVVYGYFVRATHPRRQLVEITAEFDLLDWATPFQRCIRCNGMLHTTEKSTIEHLLLPRTRTHFHEFSRCDVCGAIYWKGSHYDRMRRLIHELKRELADTLQYSCATPVRSESGRTPSPDTGP